MEVLFSARSPTDYADLALELLGRRQLPGGAEQYERALEVQAGLARSGAMHHRSVKMPDLIIAACAEAAGAVVWHYDEDFDRIAEITGQPVEWIAPLGTL